MQHILEAHLQHGRSSSVPYQTCSPVAVQPLRDHLCKLPAFHQCPGCTSGTALTFPRHRSPCHLHGPGFTGPSDFTVVTYPKGELQVSLQSCWENQAPGHAEPISTAHEAPWCQAIHGPAERMASLMTSSIPPCAFPAAELNYFLFCFV